MLRKTGIFPYIWWFWGAFGGFGGLMSVLAAVWWRMGGYGYIWCALIYYGRSLYIDAQPMRSSACSTYSFRTHCLIE